MLAERECCCWHDRELSHSLLPHVPSSCSQRSVIRKFGKGVNFTRHEVGRLCASENRISYNKLSSTRHFPFWVNVLLCYVIQLLTYVFMAGVCRLSLGISRHNPDTLLKICVSPRPAVPPRASGVATRLCFTFSAHQCLPV